MVHSSGAMWTLISRSRSTGCLQIGHLSVWNLSTFAQLLHMHCNHNNRIILRQRIWTLLEVKLSLSLDKQQWNKHKQLEKACAKTDNKSIRRYEINLNEEHEQTFICEGNRDGHSMITSGGSARFYNIIKLSLTLLLLEQ